LSEWAPSVGGGATTDRRQPARGDESTVGGGATTDRRQPGRVDGSTLAKPDTDAPAAQLIRRVLQASDDRDPRGLQAHLDVAATLLGLDRCVDEIVIPATREMSRPPLTGGRDTTRDLMATEAIRAWLNGWGSFAPAPRNIEPILLACGPRDRQVAELESLALLLRYRRWPCRVLGARTSTFTLTIATRAADATAVVVLSADRRGLPQAILSVLAVAALGVPVFVAGAAFQPVPGRDELPGRYLGTSVSGACAMVISTLTPTALRTTAPTPTAPTPTGLGQSAADE
jgi:hypothetical protein